MECIIIENDGFMPYLQPSHGISPSPVLVHGMRDLNDSTDVIPVGKLLGEHLI